MSIAPHARSAAEVAAELDVEPQRGLTSADVARRRAQFGANVVVRDAGRPTWKLFVAQFGSVVIGLLAVAAARVVDVLDAAAEERT